MKKSTKGSLHYLSVSQCMKNVMIPFLVILMPCFCQDIQQLMYTHTSYACSQPHYYETDSTYLIRAAGAITSQRCELSFLESAWSEAILEQPCYTLCVRIYNYSMSSCDVEMIYHDGLGDLKPRTFDCHTFPPLLWCSSKNDLKIEFVELEKYKGEPYDITLEIKPYCGQGFTTLPSETFIPSGDSYIERYRREERRQRDTVIITGSLVSTVSFLLVIFWIVYCCWKRRNTNDGPTSSSSTQNTSVKSTHATAANPDRSGPSVMTGDNKNWYPMSQRDHLPSYHHQSFTSRPRPDPDVRYTEMPCVMTDHSLQLAQQHRISPAKENRYRDDHLFDHQLLASRHPYDADEEVAFTTEQMCPPPLPPRPPLLQYQSRQYFV